MEEKSDAKAQGKFRLSEEGEREEDAAEFSNPFQRSTGNP